MSGVIIEALPGDLDTEAAAREWSAVYDREPTAADAELRDILGQLTRDFRPPPWGNYLARRSGVAVGICAFKSPPLDGVVEIAYGSFPAARRQGVAYAMASALLEIARAAAVSHVVAHTLPVPNESNRLLARLGFVFAGLVDDPEDGPVWRWERAA